MRTKSLLLRSRALAVALGIAVLMQALVSTLAEQNAPAGAPGLVVETKYGSVSGAREAGVYVFRGIRYAQPPRGALRFRPPVAPQPWRGVVPATHAAPACPSHVGQLENQAEDCLAVNVWTPMPDRAKRPVMVFIHGGADIEGSTSGRRYDGALVASRGDVVVVNIQYRLGAWGWLELAEIGGKDYAESGNLGILDKIAAVRWVKENIEHFGGDPNNITLWGQSTGANSVGWLMGLPQAHGLFQRAILQSGPLNCCGKSVVDATGVARAYMKAAGVSTVAQLQRLSMEEMREAQKKLTDVQFDDTLFTPVIDGVVVKEGLLDAIAHGNARGIPTIVGSTSEETRSGPTVKAFPLEEKPEPRLRQQLAGLAGAQQVDEILAAYKRNTRSYGEMIVQITSDITFRIPSIQFAALASRNGEPVYMYVFTYRSTNPRIGGAHSVDLPFVFGWLDDPKVLEVIGNEPGRETLMNNVQQAWIDFARSGNPNHSGLPHWDQYNEDTRRTMELGLDCRMVNDPISEQRRSWGNLPNKIAGEAILSENQ